MKKSATVCFTGHRFSKFGPGNTDVARNELFELLYNEICACAEKGFWYFIAGGSTGTDTLAALAVIKARAALYPELFLEIAVPCMDQDALWSESDKQTYRKILSAADKTHYVSDMPHSQLCMHNRNKYMVDNSSLVIAAYTGAQGGTKNTVEYAKRTGVPIINILENQMRFC